MAVKKSEFENKNADVVKVGDKLYIYGKWLVVKRVHHINQHPYQLYEFLFDEFRSCLRVPAGWQVRVRKVKTEGEDR